MEQTLNFLHEYDLMTNIKFNNMKLKTCSELTGTIIFLELYHISQYTYMHKYCRRGQRPFTWWLRNHSSFSKSLQSIFLILSNENLASQGTFYIKPPETNISAFVYASQRTKSTN